MVEFEYFEQQAYYHAMDRLYRRGAGRYDPHSWRNRDKTINYFLHLLCQLDVMKIDLHYFN